MNKPLIAAWLIAVTGLVVMQFLLRGNSAQAEGVELWLTGLVAALFFASALLFSKGARQSANIVRKITSWVMCAFLLLNSAFFIGFIILRAMGGMRFGA